MIARLIKHSSKEKLHTKDFPLVEIKQVKKFPPSFTLQHSGRIHVTNDVFENSKQGSSGPFGSCIFFLESHKMPLDKFLAIIPLYHNRFCRDLNGPINSK
jgi:hypothetical protein